MQLYWLQKQHTAGDNHFGSYILYTEKPNDHVLESRRRLPEKSTKCCQTTHNQKPEKNILSLSLLNRLPRLSVQQLTTFAVTIGMSGFIVQFQGLRFSNWTCAVGQLTALAVATFLRALVRRKMNKIPGAVAVENDFLLDHLTLAIIGNGSNGPKSSISEDLQSPGLSIAFGITAIPALRDMTDSESRHLGKSKSGHLHRATSEFPSPGSQLSVEAQCSRETEDGLNLAKQALNLRVRLGQITKWTGAKSQEAIILSNAIETTLKRLNPGPLIDKKYAVVLQVVTCRNMPGTPLTSESYFQEEVELVLMRDGNEWKVDDAQLEALLSLLSFSFWATKQNRKNQEEKAEETSSSSFESSGRHIGRQIVHNDQSIGWLRTKAPESQIFERIVGKSSPKLVSDLTWWTSHKMHGLKALKINDGFQENSVFAFSTSCSSKFEGKGHKIMKSPALGFYANTGASEESRMYAI